MCNNNNNQKKKEDAAEIICASYWQESDVRNHRVHSTKRCSRHPSCEYLPWQPHSVLTLYRFHKGSKRETFSCNHSDGEARPVQRQQHAIDLGLLQPVVGDGEYTNQIGVPSFAVSRKCTSNPLGSNPALPTPHWHNYAKVINKEYTGK
jgi:hypothetical protein